MSALDQLTRLNDICLYVRDFDASLKFYVEKFGFRVKRLQPNPEQANYAEFEFQGTAVTMWQIDGVRALLSEDVLGEAGHHFMIAVKVDSPGTVDEIHSELSRRGVVCARMPETYPFGARSAYYLDNEKNIWEVFAWVDGENGPGLL
jgi:catechol 2,3-dioxygenase-like lactoylglutathione lyase family enzyme